MFKYLADSDTPIAMNDRKIIRHAKSTDHDEVMIEWVKMRSEGVPLTGPLLMEQAKIFYESIGLQTEVTYSTGWLTKFKTGHEIRQFIISGEKASAGVEAAEHFVDEFECLAKEENISPEQIYNANETALYWRYVQGSTLATGNR